MNPQQLSKQTVKEAKEILSNTKVLDILAGNSPKKIIVVPKKIINIVF